MFHRILHSCAREVLPRGRCHVRGAMARIGMAKPRLSVAVARLQVAGQVVDGGRLRPDHHPWYKTARWQRLRWQVLERDGFTCRMCGRAEVDTSQLVGDHIVPHRGEAALFWDAANVQCLCKACHDGAKQRAERQGRGGSDL